jgi:battenin
MKQGNIQQRQSITAFSSGTGLAGIVGYGYKSFFSDLCGWGLSATVWSAMLLAVAYWIIYLKGLYSIGQNMQQQDASAQSEVENGQPVQQMGNHHQSEVSEASLLVMNKNEGPGDAAELELVTRRYTMQLETTASQTYSTDTSHNLNLTTFERFKLVLTLWPYMIPLFTVYAAEYMLQAGVWSAVGFPVTSASARAKFYHYSNWTYQAGVFISRSSGNLCRASIRVLWLMPFLQVVVCLNIV